MAIKQSSHLGDGWYIAQAGMLVLYTSRQTEMGKLFNRRSKNFGFLSFIPQSAIRNPQSIRCCAAIRNLFAVAPRSAIYSLLRRDPQSFSANPPTHQPINPSEPQVEICFSCRSFMVY